MYYYGARYYDPAIGRFISADTIVPGWNNPQAWNPYSYVLNNPLKYTDPTGHVYFSEVGGWSQTVDYEQVAKFEQELAIENGDDPASARTANQIASSLLGVNLTNYSAFVDVHGGADAVQTAHEWLTYSGGVPLIGIPCDIINGLMYLSGGNYEDAAWSFGGVVPIGGDAAQLVRLAKTTKRSFGDQPNVKFPGNDPKKSPGEGYEWRGNGPIGSSEGSWYNPNTKDTYHPDFNNPAHDPHYDYKDPSSGQWWRIFEDGKVEPH